jgi:acyl-CoA dehydrogenase
MIRDQEFLDQLIDIVEKFVRDRLMPAEDEVADSNRVPDHLVKEMKDLGLFGMTIPEEYGGLGLTMEEEIHTRETFTCTRLSF